MCWRDKVDLMSSTWQIGMAARVIFCVVWVLGVVGCSSSSERVGEESFHGREAEYRASRSLPPLEVPPDLVRPSETEAMAVPEPGTGGTATYSDYTSTGAGRSREPETGATVLPRVPGIRVERDANERWLVVDAPPSHVWSKLREFWVENGLTIEKDDPAIGIMETDWAENRADIYQGVIRSFLEKFTPSVYSAATRDKFRTRLERGDPPNTTEVYISHRGLEEVSQGESFVWQPRPADPELEAEMLHRLLVFLGVERQKASQLLAATGEPKARAQMVRNEMGTMLTVDEDFARAWQRTGLALDRLGFTVVDRDRSRGIYYVRYVDSIKDNQKKGWLSRLKFWGDEERDRGKKSEYLVSLKRQADTTEVVVLDADGKWDSSQTADRILSLLHEQLE